MSSLIRLPGRRFYYLQYYEGGRKRILSLRTDRAKVAKALKAKFDYELSQGIAPGGRRTGVVEVLESYLTHLKANVRESTYQKLKDKLRQLFGECCEDLRRRGSRKTYIPGRSRSIPPLKAKYLEDITPGMMQSFIDARRARDGISEKTANEIRVALHGVFEFAIRFFDFRSKDPRFPNPVKVVRRLRVPSHPIKHLGSLEEIDSQLDAVKRDHSLHAAVAVCIYCGLRRAELCWLTRDDVDLERRTLRVRAKTVDGESWRPKTEGSNRTVPLSHALLAILRRYKPRGSSPWFLPSPRGCRWNPDNFGDALAKANRKAGLRSNWLIFRHTFGTMLARAGVSLFKISKLMGNSPEICRRHYTDVQPAELVEEVEFDRREARQDREAVVVDVSAMLAQNLAKRGRPVS